MKLSQRGAGILASGLFTSIALFTLWIPFLTLFGFPLLQAEVQNGLCWKSMMSSKLKYKLTYSLDVIRQACINADPSQLDTINAYFGNLYDALNAQQSTTTFFETKTDSTNYNIRFWMWVTLVAAWVFGGYGIYYIVTTYRIPVGMFFLRNILAAFGIAFIEMTLFAGVAMQYMPWDWQKILNEVIAMNSS
jgi:hypothetical protein